MARKVVVKEGTNLFGVHPDLLRMVRVFRDVIFEVCGIRCVVTSGWDRDHSKNSLHDAGHAIDVRSNEIPTLGQKREVLRRVREEFPHPAYDILLEDIGGRNEHFHGEKNLTPEQREAYVMEVFG